MQYCFKEYLKKSRLPMGVDQIILSLFDSLVFQPLYSNDTSLSLDLQKLKRQKMIKAIK